ncbi:hypothetical protein HHI36_012202, partial [Cryptolaemus montrouzieri]
MAQSSRHTNVKQASLKTSESVCILGIHLDHILSWESHVDVLCKHMVSYTYAIRTLAFSVSTNADLLSYHSYVEAKL